MYLCVKDIECAYLYDFTSIKPGAIRYMCVNDIECVYLYEFTRTKPGTVMFLCVRYIECAYLYDFTGTTPGAVMYLCVKEIVPICMMLSVLSKERSCICVLRLSNLSICMI